MNPATSSTQDLDMIKNGLIAILAAVSFTSAAVSQQSPRAAEERVQQLAEAAFGHLGDDQVAEAMEALGEVADLGQRSQQGVDHLACTAAALHRRLAALDADERFDLLRKWSLPTESRANIRVLTSITPTDAPPSVFARALGERPRRDSFAIPDIAGLRGLFSTDWELVKAAHENGALRRLSAELAALAERKVPHSQELNLLARIVGAQRQEEELLVLLTQRAADLRGLPATSPVEPDLVLAAACLTHEWLQPIAEDIFGALVERSTAHPNSTWSRPFLCAAHAMAVRRRFEAPEDNRAPGADLAWWIAAGGPGPSDAGQTSGHPIWLSQPDLVVRQAGYDRDYLLFKYPLTGVFEFSCDAQVGGRENAVGGVVYRGREYEVSGADTTLTVRDLCGRESMTRPCPFVVEAGHATFSTLSIRATDESVTLVANQHPTWTATANSGASPWLGLRAGGHRTAAFCNLKISGNPVIPREARLADEDSLPGWMIDGAQGDWLAQGGVIHGEMVAALDGADAKGPVAQSAIHYFRPLQNKESIGYEFLYEPGRFEVHPMLGRLAFLIEPGGVRLHWLTGGPVEWTGLAEDNVVIEPLDRRGPKPLPLKPGDWNRVLVTLANDTYQLSLNDVEIYSRKLDAGGDRSFGFYHDRGHTASRVRNVALRGDWPQRLTATQLENLVAATPPRTESARRAIGALVNDRCVPGSVLGVCELASAMSPDERYAFLSAWVLPSPDHETVRTAFDFTPTNPAPSAILARPIEVGNKRRIVVGSDLVCPATDLVRLAKERGELHDLRRQVELATTKTPDDSRSRLTILVLIDLAEGDFVSANRNCDLLESIVQPTSQAGFTEHWPETLVVREGLKHPDIREAAGDLAVAILARLRAETISGPQAWERLIGSLAAKLKPADPMERADGLAASPTELVDLTHWVPAGYATALTRGQGFPSAEWRSSASQVDHRSGHHEDYLFFRSPLRGDFEVECDLGGFGWRDTELMVAGTWLSPHYSHVTYVVGNFREALRTVPIEPRLPTTGQWIRQRTVVKDGVATIFLNGRRLHEETLPPDHDPWIAIRSPFYGFGGARDVRITGSPIVPRQVRISAPPGLPGWLPYFNETVGGAGANWQYHDELEGGGIVGIRRSDVPESGLESLLRYHRPLLEDGTIEYEFYHSAGEAHVHPALDRRAFVLDPAGVRIHWVTDGPYDRTKQDPFNLSDEPSNRRGPERLPLKPASWNRLRLELTGDKVQLTLNGQLIYDCDLAPTNQRTFGLFHYADQTEARVRNIVWQGDWPREIPPVGQQELADRRTDTLDERLPALTAVFEHDFARDGFPLWRFHVYDAGWEENIEARPDGLHVRRPCGRENVRFVVSPRMHIYGDFDAVAQFEQLVLSPTEDGKWGISLRAVFEDKDTTLCSVFRGLRRRPGHLDEHMAIGEFTQWKPGGGADIWYPGQVSEEATSGRLRLARRGNLVHSFIAEQDSPNFRHIHTERVTTERGRYDGIRLWTGAFAVVDGIGSASVVWKSLVVRAEGITGLPSPPPITEQKGPDDD